MSIVPCKLIIQCQARVKQHSISDQNGRNLFPFSDLNRTSIYRHKPYPLGLDITYKGEPPPPTSAQTVSERSKFQNAEPSSQSEQQKNSPNLGSTVRHDGGAGSDIRNRLNKARNAFRMLNNTGVIPAQHQDQAKTVEQLRTFHPSVRLRMLEDD